MTSSSTTANSKEIIIELAEYLKGNRSDPNGYYASFFQRNIRGNFEGVSTSSVESAIAIHHSVVIEKAMKNKAALDIWKRRAYDFENGGEVVDRVCVGKSFK